MFQCKNLFLNADDFGLNSSVNKAIIELFDRKIINSTTIMANMPGFEEAIHLAHAHGITEKVGAHLVLTEGIPLTNEIKNIDYLFHGKEVFKKPFKNSLFMMKRTTKEIIYKELEQQIKKIKSHGINISHLDTHHHVHEVYGITKLLLQLKKEHKIPFIRILNNLNQNTKRYKLIYRYLINSYLKSDSANNSDFFGSQSDFLSYLSKNSFVKLKKIEIMVHPDYDIEGNLIDREGANHFDFRFVDLLNSAIQK
jgi:predicted glycoside hydrolase/deacetylase ChbG (UPF0249 family)